MRFIRAAAVCAAALFASACFDMTDVLKLNADGTGTIEHRMLVTAAAIKQMRQLAMLGGGRGSFDPISEKQARDLPATIGTGVTYVSSETVTTPTSEGRVSLFAFTDVSQLGIATQPDAPGDIKINANGITSEPDRIRFTLTREPNGNSVLKVITPPLKLFDAIGPAVQPNQVGIIRSMLAGAHVLLVVEPAGTIVRTTSAYRDGPRVILLEIDLDQILKDAGVMAKLQTATNEDEIKAALKDAPGVKFNFDGDVTIEFTPAAK